ncbi:MAG: acyl carrier protein [Bacteroidota bacterium]|nr:acyl carrier protein [uncultured Allomuricauda sp.]
MHDLLINYVVAEICGEHTLQLNEEDLLLEKGIVDSMGMMRLVLYIEKKFDLKVPPEDMTVENFRTIKDIGNYILRKTN